jgi:GntR family transcriptional repressor for pyruvate dehydrogenase complex
MELTQGREPLRRSSLVAEVVTLLREVIETKGLAPGDRLPTEAELVESLEVSRPVLREAISQLETLGLVQVRRGLGMFVGDRDSLAGCLKLVRTAMAVTPRDLTQFADLRSALEHHGARRAAERATPGDVAELQALCDAMDRRDLPYEEAIGIDFAFHRRLIEITGNELMVNVMSVLQEFIVQAMLQTTPRPRDRSVSRRLHRAILEAVRKGDLDGAERAMREHMKVTRARLEEAAQGDGEGAPAAGASGDRQVGR